MGDPFFDLGNFAVNHELDEEGEHALLAASRSSLPYAARSACSPSSSSSWLTAKLPRSKKGSPMPAYSQSTIQSRSPSEMKFAFRRSLWHGRAATAERRRSISSAVALARS